MKSNRPFLPIPTLLGIIAAVGAGLACWASDGRPPASSDLGLSAPAEPIKPIPLHTKLNGQKVSLGKELFHDPMLSADQSVSCASCHDLRKGGTDGRIHAVGVDQVESAVNAPTVFNSALNFKQFWDGRANTLEEQIDGPLLDTHEMGSNWTTVIARLRSAPRYAAAFGQTYSDGITPPNVKDAIAEFERSLTTPNCRFDKYLRGDSAAITATEKAGYQKFKTYGCVSCHQGVNVGGNMFETLGAVNEYFAARGGITKADFGRYNVTGLEEDRFVFKVPGLRNVALTAPYFHDGTAHTLEEAVLAMGKYQLGRTLSTGDVTEIVAFLKTLTGEYEGSPL